MLQGINGKKPNTGEKTNMIQYVKDEKTGFIKTDEKGLPLVYDDNRDDAEPFGLDGIGLHSKVPSLQTESRDRKKALKAAKEELEKYTELEIDAEKYPAWKEKADKALDVMQNLDDKKLIEANKVDEIKQQVRDELTAEKDRVEKQFKKLLQEKNDQVKQTSSQIRELVVDNQFHSSKYIGDDLVITPKMARKIFGENFKVETADNKTMAVGYMDSEPIMSRSNVGQYASFDEALKQMIESDADRDAYIRVDSKKNKQPATPVSFPHIDPGQQLSSTDKIKAGLEKRGMTGG